MHYRRLGASGCKVSAIGLGSWMTFGSMGERTARSIVRKAFDLGINFFDTADVYDQGKAEAQLGGILQDFPRKDYVLASKVYFPTGDGPNDRGLSRKHVFETVHASLRRLKTDYIDLLQCHRYDEETPVAETVRAFDDLIRQGKVLYWGVSLWSAQQLDEAVETARWLHATPPVSNQPAYSLLNRDIEAKVLPTCRRLGMGILPYSPLAQGVLTGKYNDGARPHDSRAADHKRNRFMQKYLDEGSLDRVRQMTALAGEAGMSPAQLALAWILRRDEISSVLVGSTRASQLEENAAAADLEPEPEILERLDELFPAGS